MDVLISGAGIAGPTLAWWLLRDGHNVTIVEQAPAFRAGGYVIDFWGKGYDLAERMGLMPRLEQVGYHVKHVRFLGEGGRTRRPNLGILPEHIEIPRFVAEFDQIAAVPRPNHQTHELVFHGKKLQPLPLKRGRARSMRPVTASAHDSRSHAAGADAGMQMPHQKLAGGTGHGFQA